MVPFAYGAPFDGGNSGITTAYSRTDFVLKEGRELYYLSTGKLIHRHDRAPTRLYRWRVGKGTEALAATRLSRFESTLVELEDGRIAVVGGTAVDEPPTPECEACRSRRSAEVARLAGKITGKQAGDDGEEVEDDTSPEELVPKCEACSGPAWDDHFTFARSTEIYDTYSDRWYPGPFAHHAGGRAVKLANGRIFKFGLLGYNATDTVYAAETADPKLTRWTALPAFPFQNPATVNSIWAIGNQVLIVMNKPRDRYVLWDDTTRQWRVNSLPTHSDWGLNSIPILVGSGERGQVPIIYERSYEYLPWPLP